MVAFRLEVVRVGLSAVGPQPNLGPQTGPAPPTTLRYDHPDGVLEVLYSLARVVGGRRGCCPPADRSVGRARPGPSAPDPDKVCIHRPVG